MALFTRDTIDRVRDAVDMVELVGAKTDLRRVGSRWTGLCPFHDERTPSFSVNAEDKLFYCFGCQAKGDAIGFVEQADGLDFREAVELLADRYGVKVERENEDPEEERRRRRNERLYSLLERATRFYAAYLWDSAEAARARDYLNGRGLLEETLREFRVGYAPSAWDRMLLGARHSGFTEDELFDAGLAQRGRGEGLYDRFRSRIMFPLANARGRVLGFGARQMGEGRGPKYLNTSENELYHKGRQLFGIDIARQEATKSARIVVVEGYTDVLALHQAGLRETVAIMGTALTDEQLTEMGKSLPHKTSDRDPGTVYLALDADRAGRDAMLRVARSAEDRGLDLRVIDMPEGTDPAELVTRDGADAFVERMERAAGMIQFQVARVLADADLSTPAGRDRGLEGALRLIAVVSEEETPTTWEALVREVADALDLSSYHVAGAARAARTAPTPRAAASDSSSPLTPGQLALLTEHDFLTRCLSSGALGRDYLGRADDEQFSSELSKRARAHLAKHFDDPLVGLPEDEPALGELVSGLAIQAQEMPPTDEPTLQGSILQLERRRIEREIRRAAQSGDHARMTELAAADQRVRDEMGSVTGQTA